MQSICLDQASIDHGVWSARFRSVLDGISTERFDLGCVRDDSRCEFGRWLRAEADKFSDSAALAHMDALHKTFHEVAWEIAVMVRENRPRAEIDLYLFEFDSLVRQLLSILAATRTSRNSALYQPVVPATEAARI